MGPRVGQSAQGRLRVPFTNLDGPALVWTIDREFRVRSLLGALPDDLIALADWDIAHRAALAGEPAAFESHVGGRFLRVVVEPLAAGDDGAAIGVALDVTEEARAFGALQRTEESLALTQAAAHVGSWDHDVLAGRVIWSAEMFSLCGLQPSEAVPTPELLWHFVHLEDREALEDALRNARETGEPYAVGGRLVCTDGSERWVEHRGRFVLDASGRPLRVVGSVLDLGARVGADDLRAAGNLVSSERREFEREIRRALEDDEFTCHYQPIVGDGGEVVGVEALARWHHPTRGLVAPDAFIGPCEANGLIVPLGRRLLRVALSQIRRWRDLGLPACRVAFNVSARQLLDAEFSAMIAAALEEHDVPPALLELEITESAVMSDLAGAKRAVAEVKALGARFALDDFGTGYSTLSYLKHFPVDALKIDRAFVRDLPGDRGDGAIVSAIVALGHALGLRVVAEGVETAEQAALVRKLGCDEQQGFYYARPVAAREAEALLARHRLDFPEALSG